MMISGGSFTIDSADDSVHSNASVTVTGGSFEIASGDDAFHGDDTLTVSGGTINITESYEGLEALYVIIQDGDITVVSADDGLNAAGGTDSSGTAGGRDGMFGGGGGMGGEPGGGMSSGSDGSIEISGETCISLLPETGLTPTAPLLFPVDIQLLRDRLRGTRQRWIMIRLQRLPGVLLSEPAPRAWLRHSVIPGRG